ncbi:hypothetical protein F2Q68_00038721 [Brassica cretica]|uniref:Uncharacterized protein n=1 Tax=Brassica cretica TaxID=69181 RepID=A0A8S9MKS2_BRACR|nr:hypothetical protein F2Q68_00038721 [Brassica cretica]
MGRKEMKPIAKISSSKTKTPRSRRSRSSLGDRGAHVYNSTYWLRPRSPAYQQGPSMLTEAPRHIMLTTAYRQAMWPLEPRAPKATCPLGQVPTRAPFSLGTMPPLRYAPPSGSAPI